MYFLTSNIERSIRIPSRSWDLFRRGCLWFCFFNTFSEEMILAWISLLGFTAASRDVGMKALMDRRIHAAVETSASLLSEYLPTMPERSSIVQDISPGDFFYNDPREEYATYNMYEGIVGKVQRKLDSLRRKGDSAAVQAMLHALNIHNKLLVHYSSLNRSLSCSSSESDKKAVLSEGCSVSWMLAKCSSQLARDTESFLSQIGKGMRIYHEIADQVNSNGWDTDEELKLIPRIAHNLVEYITSTSIIVASRDDGPIFEILQGLVSLTASPQDWEERLRSVTVDVDRRVELLRRNAESPTNEHQLHDSMIQELSEILIDLDDDSGIDATIDGIQRDIQKLTENMGGIRGLAPRMHLINLLGKLVFEFGQLRSRHTDGIMTEEMQTVFSTILRCHVEIQKRALEHEELFVERVELFQSIEKQVRANGWHRDEALRRISRIANNMLEYITITDDLRNICSLTDALGILQQLKRLVWEPSPERVEALKKIIKVIDEAVASIRSYATSCAESNIAQEPLMTDIVTALFAVD